jgi:hypothetical protein
MCADGTWVYRLAERSCAFDDCMVDIAESNSLQHSSYSSPTLR